MKDLKPCPYCGNTGPMLYQQNNGLFYVHCGRYLCDTKFKEYSTNKDECIKKWNENADLINQDTGEYKRDITEADRKIFYLCDGKKCGENHDCKECKHTSDVTHALNFKYDGFGGYLEQPKKGKWIKINPEKRGYADTYRCSNCLANVQLSYWNKECKYDFCPNCGADMREADNETD